MLGVLFAALVALTVYANARRGDFVYDDMKQIVGNELIQDARYTARALTSDVWAFKGDKGSSWSNYWRPVFILWLMANYRLFGLGSTLGWHIANALLHAAVVLLAFRWLRLMGSEPAIALGIVLIFAVHPAHVESVAWISGSPDLLLSASLLAALGFLILHLRRPRPVILAASGGFYSLALLSKEIGMLFPLIVFATVFLTAARCNEASSTASRASDTASRASASMATASVQSRLSRAFKTSVPFLALSALYVGLHLLLLGRTQIRTPWQTGPLGLVLTAPSLLFFYLRQSVLPLWMGPSYPLRAVTAENIGLANFWLPVAADALVAALLLRLSRRDPVRRLGLVLFLVPLLPAMNINAFTPDQIAHDRYLYLPLLGLLMVLVPAGADFLSKALPIRQPSGRGVMAGSRVPIWSASQALRARAVLAAAAACSVPLALLTLGYSTAWTSELNLWQRGAASDPGSPTNHSEYARALFHAGRLREATASLDRALAIVPLMTGYLLRADIATAENRPADAERDLKLVLAEQPDNGAAYERLAVIYTRQGRLAEAEDLLRGARERVPHKRCAFTDSLAVVLYQEDRKPEALAELESVRGMVAGEYGSSASFALYHLGSLYAEMNRAAEARAALEQFLTLTAHAVDEPTRRMRTAARSLLSRVRG